MAIRIENHSISNRISILALIIILTALITSVHGQAEGSKIILENIMFDKDTQKMIIVTFRNVGDNSIRFDRIYINNESFPMNTDVDNHAVKDVTQAYNWEEGAKYNIRLVTANGSQINTVQTAPINTNAQRNPGLVTLLIISLLVFLMLIFIGSFRIPQRDKKSGWGFDLEHGQIRSAIAGTLVFGFVILTLFTLYYPVVENNIYVQYSQFVAIVIGFYFGSRSTATAGIAGAELARDATAKGMEIARGSERYHPVMIG